MCENLIYSIRKSGCQLPIRLIHFGGREVNSVYIKSQVEFLNFDNFPEEAKSLIGNLRTVLTDCPVGYLYRYLAWFADWEEFIYTDNDVVALCNWDILFEHMKDCELLHADEEYTTEGRFNYDKPQMVKSIFGESALASAMTAGHIVVKRSSKMIADINNAVEWFKLNPSIAKRHDQSLMHIASLLGKWKIINLCKPPYNWLSSWAGDYKNSLQLIQQIQIKDSKISHIHFSGGVPKGDLAIQDLLFSALDDKDRLKSFFFISAKSLSGYNRLTKPFIKLKRFVKSKKKNQH